ncbi:MAG: hypothetical protein KatS3mg076_0916 [Candidatus Binatia bacterium]|nr:MAG: hypothetical protein KatS3mg076_0916 [Candidatus Binatia bacterium]
MQRILAKPFLLLSLGVLSSGLLVVTAPGSAEEKPARAIVVQVGGLACPFCAYGLEKHLGRLSGVKRVETEIARGEVVLELEEDKPGPSESEIREAVKRAGFTLLGIRDAKTSPGPHRAE